MGSLATIPFLVSLLILSTTATPVPDALIISIRSSSSHSSFNAETNDDLSLSPFSNPRAYPTETLTRSSANRAEFQALLDALKEEDCELQLQCYDGAWHCEDSYPIYDTDKRCTRCCVPVDEGVEEWIEL
ncbi:hypothetical protein K491DRAFT_777002 [Lophiostoma macrostomum CBS 122681]|uniref:Uncharacterized protein n=1 Tax=Lophiostoma macrostomum CBS 122681 TaxID=1314788 RepID=A0A6A6TF41_9PLEO|nr:hypothetical protein K491DRAFT_777002 [Lophiostoma macrostomum CBS 122681]